MGCSVIFSVRLELDGARGVILRGRSAFLCWDEGELSSAGGDGGGGEFLGGFGDGGGGEFAGGLDDGGGGELTGGVELGGGVELNGGVELGGGGDGGGEVFAQSYDCTQMGKK
ncbi:glycine-rich protein 2-like [Morus notabilis]|uniref:glycine-rich protein 2-like n=1 Tax=Morus notabilis TaxID=981085 RepID=UPI000CED1472|nr:glycine-rich protein 2-like [Morus notabilis]